MAAQSLPRNALLFLLIAVASLGMVFYSPDGTSEQQVIVLNKDFIDLVTPAGKTRFEVEIAAQPRELSRGLMYRRELGEHEGMLFLFGKYAPVNMWMKNTYISLDMLFLQRDGTVSHIIQNTTPLSENVLSSQGPIYAVLELPAGAAKKWGADTHSKVIYKAFEP